MSILNKADLKMKVTTLKTKFNNCCEKIEAEVEKIENLADDFEDSHFSYLISLFSEQIYAIIANEENQKINTTMINDFLDDLIENE